MKVFKWFSLDDPSEDEIRKQYAELTDGELAAINPSELTTNGLRCYRAELESRKRRPASSPPAAPAPVT